MREAFVTNARFLPLLVCSLIGCRQQSLNRRRQSFSLLLPENVGLFYMQHRWTWNLNMYSAIADTLAIEMVKYHF